MSVLDQHRRDLQRQREKLAAASRAVADLGKKLSAKQSELGRAATPSRRRSLQGEIERLARDRGKAEEALAARQRDVARLEEKTAREQAREGAQTASTQRQLVREQERARASLERSVTAAAGQLGDLRARMTELESVVLARVRDAVAVDPVRRAHDVFLSHAGPDRQVAGELYNEFVARGLDVWFDGAELRLGESLTRQIDRGIANSRLGVVLVTEAFLQGRQWTERELGGLMSGRRRIIPVLEGISFDDLAGYSPLLADFTGLSTDTEGLGEIAEQVAATLRDAGHVQPMQDVAVPGLSGTGPPSGRRVLGQDAETVRIAEDFDAPLPADLLAAFER